MSRFAKLSVLSATLLLAACNAPAPENTEPDVPAMDQASSSSHADAESSITFTGKSNIINHEGHFERFTTDIERDATTPDDLTKAALTVTIDMTSVQSDPGVTGHMQKEDFFDVAQYPEATFSTTSITAGTTPGEYVLNGDITIKGVTKQVSINATVDGDMLTAHYDLPRKDFGVGNDSYGDKLLEEIVPVDITLHLE